MRENKLSLIVGGEAGAGITVSGFLFAKACVRGGLYAFGVNDYQSLIRGGHNFYIVRVEDQEIYSQTDRIDLLLALNKETILIHKNELVSGGGIIYDGEEISLDRAELGREDVKLFPTPLGRFVKEIGAKSIVKNTVGLGAAVALLDYDFGSLEEVIRDTFKGEAADTDVKAATMGYDYAKQNYEGRFEYRLRKLSTAGKRKILLTGNEAVGLGAIQAGCKFYAGYPMTPTSPLLHFMAANERKYGMIVMHPEGEIAAINMVVGATFAGVRTMTATSGGGFCLMAEGLGMAGMTENPIVIMVGQRSGPSTGLPTYGAQGDLRFVLHASQGEFPRAIIAPGDAEECFYKTMEAFNLAEKYQIQAIILTDKSVLESHATVNPFDIKRVGIDRGFLLTGEEYKGAEEYLRYRFTDNGISPRIMPGTKGAIVRANSDEHNEYGYTTEKAELTSRMADKRFRKLDALVKGMKDYETTKLYGPEEADATILGWGSTKGPIREAIKLLTSEGLKINYLQIIYLNPFPADRVKITIKAAKRTIVVENNKTSQLSSLIRENTLMAVDHKILKYDGRPFNPVELSQEIRSLL